MKLTPKPGSPPERILLFGSYGVGKTEAYLSLAQVQPGATLHVLNSDGALSRVLFGRSIPNVAPPIDVESWSDYVEATREVCSKMKPTDWLVIDLLGPAWQAAHDYYLDQKFGKAPEDFYLKHALSAKKGSPLQGDTDWSTINKIWFAYAAILKKCPGNLFATTGERATGERDGAQVIADYGHLGARPDGQKGMGHIFHSVLRVHRKRTGERLLSTAKDYGRRELKDAEFRDFATGYLLPVAGWRPAS